MRKLLSAATAAVMLVSIPLAAQAFPVASPTGGNDPNLTLVAGGCGPAFHRGPMGGCRPNAVVVLRPRVVCRIVGLIPHRVCRRGW